MISYYSNDMSMPIFPKRKISNWIEQVAKHYQKRVGEINFIFCSEETILELNNTYLNHDYFTDIITFDYSENDQIAGDLYISINTVRSNADKFKETFTNEFFRVMIHGVLHLCGINDKSVKQRNTMKANENEALELLKL